jgi:mycothiol synthase
MLVRDFTADDYPSAVRIHNAIFPDRARLAEGWAAEDRARNPKCKTRRWIALRFGDPVGFTGYSQSLFNFDPGKFHVTIEVLPSYQRQGIGATLYDHVIEDLQSFDLSKLRADGYANHPEGVRFLERRGFLEVFRERPLHLDVNAFDPGPHAGLEERLREEGIEIKSLRELEQNPSRDRRLYEFYWEATEDVHREHPIEPMAYEEWAEWTLEDPLVVHEGYFVATSDESLVGISEFAASADNDALLTGLVGVRRGYRNKGIARAMQLRAIRYARTHGHSLIKTSTSVTNLPMLAVYGRLGYEPQPDWIQLEKVFDAW